MPVGTMIGKGIKYIINILLLPVLIPIWVVKVFTDGLVLNKNKRNREQADEVRRICELHGVEDADYQYIVLNQMERAKEIAQRTGQRGWIYEKEPWLTRLAYAIVALHRNDLEVINAVSPEEQARRDEYVLRSNCADLGVPADDFDRIINCRIGEAKTIALHMSNSTDPLANEPWLTQLSHAIAFIHQDDLEKPGSDSLKALKNYLIDLQYKHGAIPKALKIEASLYDELLESPLAKDPYLKDIMITPSRRLDSDTPWKASW